MSVVLASLMVAMADEVDARLLIAGILAALCGVCAGHYELVVAGLMLVCTSELFALSAIMLDTHEKI